ncbi:Hypothetical protein FSTVST1_414 [Faustovirus ST1]|nr:Hypothetical protein FSTVST1_414 [Faustovirus ST1]
MSFLGAYKAKYEYSDFAPQYRVAVKGGGGSGENDKSGEKSNSVVLVEPDFADANMIDPEVADIGAKLGEFEKELSMTINGGMDHTDAVLHDEILGNRINIIGRGNESASTVEPEVRRIFGEYQIAAMIDSLSDESDDYDTDTDNDYEGGEDSITEPSTEHINDEKTYFGITYYKVNNSRQDDLSGVNIENVVDSVQPIASTNETFDINDFLE